ncbi:MAG: FKBP-type peptidyl-prolyl cis-trans isomerase, partial [Pseudonocardia sp.]|nr:FKBP-type peptidyl-prolyl cis-trans isomerase [Pseudonocardia sp.]
WDAGDAPVQFPLSGVVPGFSQGIEGMAVGGRRVIVMPPELAYGDNPPPGLPADATLVFVVDLVGIS